MSTPALEMPLVPQVYGIILERIDSNLIPFLVSASLSFRVVFLQYAFAIWLLLSGGRSAMPFWMHSFYLANDSVFCFMLGAVASQYGNHWFLRGTSVALAVWTILEIYCIWRALTRDRGAVFSDLMGHDPRLSSVLWYPLAQQTAYITNIAIAVGPLHEYIRRRSSAGLSLSLCVINALGTALTFSPFSMWAITLPEIFAQPAYHAAGAVLTLHCIGCFATVRHYDPKSPRPSDMQPLLRPLEGDK